MGNVTVWVTIAVYIILIAIISTVSGRQTKTVADFTVGGRNAGAWLSALSYGTAYFSAVMFVGYAGGTGLKYGLWGIAAGLGNAIFGSWLAWRMLARRTRDVSARLKIKTMPQFFEMRYGSTALKTFSAIVIFLFMVPYSASVYKGLASVADVLLGIDDTVCMIIIAAVAIIILVFGGYIAQARADFVQGIVMMTGISLLIFFVVRCDIVNGFKGIAEYAKTEAGLPHLSSSEAIALISTVLMTSFGTWGLPQMVQKYFGIKDDKQAKRGIIISTFFAMLVAGGGYFIGSLCHMFFTAETMPAQDYIIPEMLARVNMPNILLGVVLVLLIAASVSTLCSITLTASSTLSMDLIKSKFSPKMAEKSVSKLTKILCVLFVIVSYFVANTDTPILDMMSYSWGIVSGSFLAPYVLALYWKKLTRAGAWSGVLAGFITALIPAASKMLLTFGVQNDALANLASQGPVFAVAAMIISLAFCFVVSLVTHADSDEKNKSEIFYSGTVSQE